MRTSAEKSSTTTSPTITQAARQPFVARAGRSNFFAPARPGVQTKMTVNKPGDKFEQEADKTADKVMRMSAPSAVAEGEKLKREPEEKPWKREEEKILRAAMPEEKVQRAEDDKIQRASADEQTVQRREEEKILRASTSEEKVQKGEHPQIQKEADRDEKLQREAPAGTPPAIDSGVQTAIYDKMTGGEPLPTDVRANMEARFNADFRDVRIHRDDQSVALSNQLGARAFTYRNHIFFSRDQYQPGTSDGKQLLAHELTHTIQQGYAVQRGAEMSTSAQGEHASPVIQRAPASAAASAATSSEVVNISSNVFSPSQRVKDEIEARGRKGLDIRIIVKGLTAEGLVKIRADRARNFDSIDKGSMPLMNPWTQKLGGMHINFCVVNNQIVRGYASLKPRGGDTNDWLQALQKSSDALGGLGLKVSNVPAPINKFDNGKLTLGVSGLNVEVGGFLDARFNVSVENASQPKITATSVIDIRGMLKGTLILNNDSGKLAGQVSLAINYDAFSGDANVIYKADGSVDIGGKAAYSGDKLSGEVQFVATDREAADAFTKNAIAAAGGQGKVQDAAPPAPVPAPKSGQKKRALAATGQLAFNLTKWFAGTVNVIVDGKGAVTVIGKIAPPGEIELFKQKDWDKEIVKFEAKAYYGIPVVGNLNLFANISLHALAKLGPAKIYNIEILGTYSTDPEVQKSIQISGSINISAYGGLRLRAEGGAGIEIVSHDLKFGIGLNADVGVKAYADARPTIGYRDPGVFYISGTLELVAQPMLGLGGDFFIALETPWWSPLSDDRWTWPLFSKEWPLTDPIGISAAVKDYELGSGKVPEIELKKPEFDPSKFMTSMVDNNLPDKSGGAGAGQGTFKEDGTVPKPVVPPKKPAPKVAASKPPRKGAPLKSGKSAAPDPKAARDQQSGKILESAAKPLAALKAKEALTRSELDKDLAKIKGQVGGIEFGVQVKGEKWLVIPKAGGKAAKGVEVAAKQIEQSNKDRKPDALDPVRAKIDMNGAGHVIEAVPQGNTVRLFMASRRETLREKLVRESGLWTKAESAEIRSNGQALAARLATVMQREEALTAKYAATADNAQRHALAVAGVNEIGVVLVAIASEFGITVEDEDIPRATPFQPSGLNLGRATRVYADPLTATSLRERAATVQFAPGGFLRFPGRDKYAAGHLLADTLGGPNEASNLALISRGTNGKFSSRESLVRNALRGTKRIPEPRTVLRYEVSCSFAADPQGEIEGWMRQRYAAKFPQARFDGIGTAIMQMAARAVWDTRAIDRHLGLTSQPIAFYDMVMWKVAKAYLPTHFTISIRTYTGKPVTGDSFDNHIGGMGDPPDQ
jgi:hypothetical protein